jgi:hypothetical protein
MKSNFLNGTFRVGGVFLLCAIILGAAEAVPYRTSFEEPGITPGTINGQDGWESFPTGSGVVQNTQFVGRGASSLMISASAEIHRPLSAPGQQTVYVDGYYRGPSVSVMPDPTTLPEGTSLILFHTTSGIMVLNGNGLQRITIAQDYQTSTWSLFIDGQMVKENLGFKDNEITQLNGISIETADSGEGFLDDFSVLTSVPDFLAEPKLFYFQSDWGKSEGEFNWDIEPLSPDGRVDAKDLLQLIDPQTN